MCFPTASSIGLDLHCPRRSHCLALYWNIVVYRGLGISGTLGMLVICFFIFFNVPTKCGLLDENGDKRGCPVRPVVVVIIFYYATVWSSIGWRDFLRLEDSMLMALTRLLLLIMTECSFRCYWVCYFKNSLFWHLSSPFSVHCNHPGLSQTICK